MNLKQVTVTLSLFLLLGMYAAVSFFSFPFADDFCFGWTASESISLWQKFLNQYLYWNGRYTSDLLVQFHPLLTGKILAYQLTLLAGILLLPITLIFFLYQLLQDTLQTILISLFITAFYFTYMPDITEELYWFIGSVNYQWAHAVVFAQLGFFLQSIRSTGRLKPFRVFGSITLLTVGIGFNEVAAVLLLCFYALICLGSALKNKTHLTLFMAHALVALVCFGFVFVAPGNAIRAENFPNKHQLFYSMGYSSLQTFRFIGLWMLTVPFWVFTVIAMLNAHKVKGLFNLNLDYRICGIASLLVVFIGAFLPYYATGLLGQHRTINFVFLFFILLYLLFLVALSKRFLLYEKWSHLLSSNRQFLILAIAVASMFFSGSSIKVIKDFSSGAFAKYQTAFYQRQKAILENKDEVIVPLKELPETFRIADVKGDRDYWTDKCMANFYRETGIEIK